MRQYLMELMGAFFLTLAVSFTGNPVAVGLMFMAMFYVGEHISGGYFNPALTVAGWFRGLIAVEEMLLYMGVQVFGAFLAARLVPVITSNVFMPDVGPDVSVGMSMLIEGLLTAVLCMVFLTVVTHKEYKSSAVAGVVLGLTIVPLLYIGGLFNPAVAAGAMICQIVVSGSSAIASDIGIIYVVAPLLGGGAAAFAYDYFHKR